jgi:hypothetical protein
MNAWMVGVEVVGGIYSPQPPIQLLGQAAVDGAPDSPVRQPRHPTVMVLTVSTVGALSSCGTGQSGAAPDRAIHCLVRLLAAALTLHELSVHCSTFASVRYSRPLHWSRYSTGAPDSPVNYSGAALLKPEGGKFRLVRPWAPDTVRWHTGQSNALD